VGVPDVDLGEEVTGFVSLKRMEKLATEELLDYCKQHLARYKYPRRIFILPELPKGPTGKILKSALIEMVKRE
jgi:long-chain acyl-CoA synthetase